MDCSLYHLSRRRLLPALFALAMFPAILAMPGAAQEAPLEDSAAIESGRKALRRSNRYPWYDASNDSLRRVEVLPDRSAENLNRHSQWQTKPPAPPRQIPTFSWPTWIGPFFQVLAVLLLLAIFGFLLWLIVWFFMRRERDEESASGVAEKDEARGDIDRIENLPFQVKRGQSDLRGEAERNYQEGNYREAIIYLYSYLLVQLDRFHVVRLTKGKTNRQYLREVRQRPELLPMFEPTMIAFEDVFFGNHPISRGEFESCWNKLPEFQRLLEKSHQAAA